MSPFNNPYQNFGDMSPLRDALNREEFNERLRPELATEFQAAVDEGRISDVMLMDAQGHPVAERALRLFLPETAPGTFQPMDFEGEILPQTTPEEAHAMRRFGELVLEVFQQYAAITPEQRSREFGHQPLDIEPKIEKLVGRVEDHSLSYTELLEELVGK